MASSMACFSASHFNYTFIILHFIHRTFGEYATLMQHGNSARNRSDKVHIMLDHDDRVFPGQRIQQFCSALGFEICHTRYRLIQ